MNECYLLPRDRQLEAPIAHCDICGAELYKDDPAFYDPAQGIVCCEDCAPDVAMEYLTPILIGDEH